MGSGLAYSALVTGLPLPFLLSTAWAGAFPSVVTSRRCNVKYRIGGDDCFYWNFCDRLSLPD